MLKAEPLFEVRLCDHMAIEVCNFEYKWTSFALLIRLIGDKRYKHMEIAAVWAQFYSNVHNRKGDRVRGTQVISRKIIYQIAFSDSHMCSIKTNIAYHEMLDQLTEDKRSWRPLGEIIK